MSAQFAGMAAPDNTSTGKVPVTIAEVFRLYPEAHVWDTGGCIDLDGGGYILFFPCDCNSLSPASILLVNAVRFAENDDEMTRALDLPIGELSHWIDRTRERTRNPKSVADYYLNRLHTPCDEGSSLATLPLESPIGKECAHAIDAASDLIAHVREVLGEPGEHLRNVISYVVLRVVTELSNS